MTKKNIKTYPLKDSPFYKLTTKKKLAELLQTSPHAMKETLKDQKLYVRKWKHKKNHDDWIKYEPQGELADIYRPIDIPAPRLRVLQSRIALLLSRIAPPYFLFSPVKGRSYVDNAAIHRNSKAFWMLDIANYFPSCTANNVAWFFGKVMQCSEDVTALLVRLTTLNGSLPQGSPCSPILAYFANMNMWNDIEGIVKRYQCIISVYADDITLSFRKYVPKRMIYEIKKRIILQGLKLKDNKEASVVDNPAAITGVIVRNGKTFLPNRQHKLLAELRCTYATEKNVNNRNKLKRKLAGRVAQKKQIEIINGYS